MKGNFIERISKGKISKVKHILFQWRVPGATGYKQKERTTTEVLVLVKRKEVVASATTSIYGSNF